MGRYTPLVMELASRLRGMDLSALVYFHTDHFEPWRPLGRAPAVGPEIVDAIGDFCLVTGRIDFARKLSLFYKPYLNYALRDDDGLLRAVPDDLVGFLPRGEHEERFGREAMSEVVASSAHDVQLHIHHEHYTATTAHTDPKAVGWFASPRGRALDPQRLELAIRLNREIIERETGRKTTRWFFVHGHWALNASDDSSCTITNEIDILLRSGCLGDFTFPAGRKHTTPRIEVPYLCKPCDEAKGYDCLEAEPEAACGNAAAARRKFFVWNSPATYLQSSIDLMSGASRRHIENTEKAARELIDNAYVADRRLYIKTHAHSMHPFYFEHARLPVFPHQFPATQALLSVVFDAAALAGLDVQFLAAPEVYDQLISAEKQPDVDLAAVFLKSEDGSRPGSPSARQRVPFVPGARRGHRTAATAPLTSARAMELVSETAATVVRQRIDALGELKSGAYEYYAELLAQGFLVTHHELIVLDLVRRKIPHLESYHVIGSGIGILPFLLALNGFPAVGIEWDGRRHEMATSIWRELNSMPEVGELTCRLALGHFPTVPGQRSPAPAVAIFADFETRLPREQVERAIAILPRYSYVVLDLQRFGLPREGLDTCVGLLRDLWTQGFVPVEGSEVAAESKFALLRNTTRVTPGSWSSLRSWLIGPLRKAITRL